MSTPLCDWCGRPAITKTFRTLYEGTEGEQTSAYCECAECLKLSTNKVVGKYTSLCTFPDNDFDYCKTFVVETEWLEQYLEKNIRVCSLKEFVDSYFWDESWFIYLAAVAQKKVISESSEDESPLKLTKKKEKSL